ncbi:MAG: mechanosensitive ion channel family protein [Firmicutes bacterium]|nr:mechanosensitive ion channel family protein [Bacillota bacterium]
MSMTLNGAGEGAVRLMTAFTLFLPILKVIAIALIGAVLIKMACKILNSFLEKSQLDPVMFPFVTSIARILMWVIVVMMILPVLGIEATSFVAVLGTCGAAVALALKDSLANVAGGVLISINKPFAKGDYINNMSVEGTVDQIDILCTTIHTADNKIITIPNGSLSNSTIINYSRSDLRRLDMKFSIGYGDSIDQAKDIVLAVAESSGLMVSEPEPMAGVDCHGDSAIILVSKIWVKNSDYWNLYYYMNQNVKEAFDEQGISIPFPQMDVHMDKAK